MYSWQRLSLIMKVISLLQKCLESSFWTLGIASCDIKCFKKVFAHVYILDYFMFFLQQFQSFKYYNNIFDPSSTDFVQSERYGSSLSLLCVGSWFFKHHLLKMPFFQCEFWHRYQKLDVCSCVGLFLSFLFYLMDLDTYLHTNAIVLLLPWNRSVIWNQYHDSSNTALSVYSFLLCLSSIFVSPYEF